MKKMENKKILSVLPVNGNFAVAANGIATGQVYSSQEKAQEVVDLINEELGLLAETLPESTDIAPEETEQTQESTETLPESTDVAPAEIEQTPETTDVETVQPHPAETKLNMIIDFFKEHILNI